MQTSPLRLFLPNIALSSLFDYYIVSDGENNNKKRGDILYLVQNICEELQRAVNRLQKNYISISSLRLCRG
nr:MAG TPA: hypothetical protein [Caudoviricetes sp.]